MKKTSEIPVSDFKSGVYIDLECCICGHQAMFGADAPEELSEILENEEWKQLDSDKYGVIGWYCGCDYMED